MTKINNTQQYKEQYSKDFFRKSFPPNHNPLIGTLQGDTLHNVHDVIAMLQDLIVNSNDNALSESVNAGYYFLIDCTLRALRFELYHRSGSNN